MSDEMAIAIDGLLPCPHCGEEEHLYRGMRDMGRTGPFWIDCLGCGAEFTPRDGADVVAAWNRRAPDPRIAELESELATLRKRAEAEGFWLGKTTEKEVKRATDHASTSPGPENCNIRKRFQKEAVPRICERCAYGPCPFFHDDGDSRALDFRQPQ